MANGFESQWREREFLRATATLQEYARLARHEALAAEAHLDDLTGAFIYPRQVFGGRDIICSLLTESDSKEPEHLIFEARRDIPGLRSVTVDLASYALYPSINILDGSGLSNWLCDRKARAARRAMLALGSLAMRAFDMPDPRNLADPHIPIEATLLCADNSLYMEVKPDPGVSVVLWNLSDTNRPAELSFGSPRQRQWEGPWQMGDACVFDYNARSPRYREEYTEVNIDSGSNPTLVLQLHSAADSLRAGINALKLRSSG